MDTRLIWTHLILVSARLREYYFFELAAVAKISHKTRNAGARLVTSVADTAIAQM